MYDARAQVITDAIATFGVKAQRAAVQPQRARQRNPRYSWTSIPPSSRSPGPRSCRSSPTPSGRNRQHGRRRQRYARTPDPGAPAPAEGAADVAVVAVAPRTQQLRLCCLADQGRRRQDHRRPPGRDLQRGEGLVFQPKHQQSGIATRLCRFLLLRCWLQRYAATSDIPNAQLSRHPLHSHLAA